ncbi:MAG: S-layer homology domain-containing protein, partial [Bacillota bacterium]|nr:S-layer homology domain-containing protein [Bacillota bacterium]
SDRASFASFPDAGQVSAYAREALQWAVGTGLMVGSDGKLLPRDSATRAQVAMMIYRYANMYE